MKVHEYRITNLNQVRAMKKTKKGKRNKKHCAYNGPSIVDIIVRHQGQNSLEGFQDLRGFLERKKRKVRLDEERRGRKKIGHGEA